MPVSRREFTFYLGTHIHPHLQETDVPLFISRRILANVKRPISYTKWVLDSGGFTELSMYGKWITPPGTYAAQTRWWYDNVSGMQWAAIQDWMCEPFILDKTRLTVVEHQQRTIESYIYLRKLQPRIPWVPVLQGYAPTEYMDHIKQYKSAGIDLTILPIVGIGSVCRRQSKDVDEAEDIIKQVWNANIRLHAFGFKTTGLKKCWKMLVSADSMAWSYTARIQKLKLSECTHKAKNCANCLKWALQWRDKVLSSLM